MNIDSSGTSRVPWSIRAVQLDLARQRETPKEIAWFARRASEWGFNTLFLYLEGIVRTASFPDRPAHESYDAKQITAIVADAMNCGLAVVPCVSTLGHAEHFLAMPRLSHLGVSSDGTGGYMFNPSDDRTYEFLAKYLAEIAALFPSPHFHVGCDEAWELGAGVDAQARFAAGETYADLFIKHVCRIRDIVRPLGKRVWMWDDLLEYLTEKEISRLPRDVLLCCWSYSPDGVDPGGNAEGHFNGLRRRDVLGLYERLGFEVLACPWARSVRNTVELTRYARRRRVVGGIQTIWELSRSFLPSNFPGAAVAGALWSNPDLAPDEAAEQTLQRLLPSLSPQDREIVELSLADAPHPSPAFPAFSADRGLFDAQQSAVAALCETRLNQYRRRDVDDASRSLLHNLYATALTRRIICDQNEWLIAICRLPINPREMDPAWSQYEALRRRMEMLVTVQAELWKLHRPGLTPDRASAAAEAWLARLDRFANEWRSAAKGSRGCLFIDLYLHDCCSAPVLKLQLQNGTADPITIFQGSAKPTDMRRSSYRIGIPVFWPHARPTSLAITVSGYGGQGISYAQLLFDDVTLVPSKVVAVQGLVSEPEAAITPDPYTTYLGDRDLVAAFMAHAHAVPSSVTFELDAAKR